MVPMPLRLAVRLALPSSDGIVRFDVTREDGAVMSDGALSLA